MLKVISLAGPANVGKSTTAKAMVKEFKRQYPDLNVSNAAFADPLYGITSALTGVEDPTLRSQDYKNVEWTEETAPMPCLVGWTPRKFLQIVGTECFRANVHDNFWVQAAIAANNHLDIVIMEDARFDNEYIASDYVIELSRDGVEYACDHPSAMPPNQDLIDEHIHLTEDITFDNTVTSLYNMLTAKAAC